MATQHELNVYYSATPQELDLAQSLIVRGKAFAARGDPRIQPIINVLSELGYQSFVSQREKALELQKIQEQQSQIQSQQYQGPIQQGTSEEVFRQTGKTEISSTPKISSKFRDIINAQQTRDQALQETFRTGVVQQDIYSGPVPQGYNKQEFGQSGILQKISSMDARQLAIEAARDPTLKEALGQIKTAAQERGISEAIKQTPALYAALTKPLRREQQQEERFNVQVEKAGTRYVYSDEDIQRAMRGEGGTAQGFRIEDVPTEQLRRNVKFGGDAASYGVLANREQEEHDLLIKEASINERNMLVEYQKELINKISSNEISADEADRLLSEKQAESQQVLLNLAQADLKERQKSLDKIANELKISRAVISIAGSFLLGAGAGAGIAAAPRAVQTAASFAGGAAVGYQTLKLGKAYSEGEAGLIDIAAFAANIGAFILGARISSAKRIPMKQLELETAIQNSKITYNSKGLLTEAQLYKLKIPAEARAELEYSLRGGGSARIVEYELKPQSKADSKLIKREMPYIKIQFVEITDEFGSVVNRIALGEVKVKGKGKVFREDVLSLSEGYITPEGTAEFTTLTQVGKPNSRVSQGIIEGAREAILTEEKISGNVRPINENLRIVQSEAGVKLVERIEATSKKGLSANQIKNLLLSMEKGKPISEAQFLEIQKRRFEGKGAFEIGEEALFVKEEDFITKGKGISEQVLEIPKQKAKYPKTPFSKTFEEEFKGAKQDSQMNKVLDKIDNTLSNTAQNIKQAFKNIPSITPINVEEGIKSSLGKAAKQFPSLKEDLIFAPRTNLENVNKQLRKQDVYLDINSLNKQLEKTGQRSQLNQVELLDVAEIERQMIRQNQSLGLNLKQIQKQTEQMQQLRQVPASLRSPKVPIPTLPELDIPMFPSLNQVKSLSPKNIEKNFKKLAQRELAYAASLGEAAFGTDVLEVTPEQLKKLGQREYTGLESRPVIALKAPSVFPKKKATKKKSKKSKKK